MDEMSRNYQLMKIASTGGLSASSTRQKNPWNEFQQKHKGQHYSPAELSAMYREEIKGNKNGYDRDVRMSTAEDILAMLQDMIGVPNMCQEDNFEAAQICQEIEQNQQAQYRRTFNEKVRDDAAVDLRAFGSSTLIPCDELEKKEKIGSGTFGDVFAGIWKGKKVAIKTLKMTISKKALEKFAEEVRLLSSLQHRGVTAYFGYTVNPEKTVSLVMEYLPDGSLWDCIFGIDAATSGPVAEFCSSKREIVMQLLDAVSYLHKKGLAHRDIKLRNILVNAKEKKIAICDFGLAAERNQSLSASSSRPHEAKASLLVGTATYCAPEILQGIQEDQNFGALCAADVYALSLVITEILSGEEVFYGIPPRKLEEDVAKRDIRPLSELRKASPNKGVTDVVVSAWQKDWKKRPTISDMIIDMEKHWPKM